MQLAFAREVEDFDSAVGQLAYMPSNQFLGVQLLGVGEGCQRQRLRLRRCRLPSCISARRYRVCGCGLHACEAFQFALHGVLRAACETVP
jgi:hypothetical protein